MKRMFIRQCQAELIRMSRNRYYIIWSLLMPIMFYFIFTRIMSTPEIDAEVWKAHYLMSMTTFSIMGSSIMTLGIKMVQERSEGWTLYLKITPLPTSIYFTAKIAAQTVLHLFSILVIFLAGYIVNGVSLTPSQWLLCILWILFGSMPFLAIGTLVGAMKKVETAAGISNVVYIALAVAGGMWMPVEVFPKFMQEISKWLPSNSFAEGAWELIRGNSPSVQSFLLITGYLFLFMVLSIYIRKKQNA